MRVTQQMLSLNVVDPKDMLFFIVIFFGVHSGGVTHVPFPNTVVKNPSGDGTANLTVGE